MISNQQDILAHLEAKTPEQAKRHVYKYTDCGAWIEFKDDCVRVGSIVEGADFGTTIYKLSYPFEATLFDRAIEAIEAEADAIWKWANGEDGEDQVPADLGIDAPDIALDYHDLEPYRDGISS